MDLVSYFHSNFYPDLDKSIVAEKLSQPNIWNMAVDYVNKKHYSDIPTQQLKAKLLPEVNVYGYKDEGTQKAMDYLTNKSNYVGGEDMKKVVEKSIGERVGMHYNDWQDRKYDIDMINNRFHRTKTGVELPVHGDFNYDFYKRLNELQIKNGNPDIRLNATPDNIERAYYRPITNTINIGYYGNDLARSMGDNPVESGVLYDYIEELAHARQYNLNPVSQWVKHFAEISDAVGYIDSSVYKKPGTTEWDAHTVQNQIIRNELYKK